VSVRRGDVVLLRAPFTSGGGTKTRPMLVVQNDTKNARMANTILSGLVVAGTHDNDASDVMNGNVGWRVRTSRSSAVTSSYPSRSASATRRQSLTPMRGFLHIPPKRYIPDRCPPVQRCAVCLQTRTGFEEMPIRPTRATTSLTASVDQTEARKLG
jgi:hypothetical protein